MPIGTSNYAIAAGHHLTASVAEEILKSGGNAFDAAVAAYCVMFVTEPAMASPGAGGFANIFSKEKGNVILDFFCQTPQYKGTKDPNYIEVEVDFGESKELFYCGPSSMAVPGSMAGINYLIKHHCSIPIRELVQPAIQLAKDGVKLTAFQAVDLVLLEKIFGLSETGRNLFFNGNDLKEEGDNTCFPELADFLDVFAREPRDWFYRGEIAKQVVEYCDNHAGLLQYEDFIAYSVVPRTPFHFPYAGRTISVPPLPSMGGGLMALFLNTMGTEKIQALSAEHLSLLRKAFATCIPFTKDKVSLKKQIIDRFGFNLGGQGGRTHVSGGTSHFNIADGAGNAISLSTSIGEGSGYFIPNTQIQMNNMLGETALMPNGLMSWDENTRLNSMMCPTMVLSDNGQPELLTGTGGATRIPFSLAQMLYNHFTLNMDLESAIHAPRIYENATQVYLEGGYDVNKIVEDKSIRSWEALQLLFGGTHTISLSKQIAVGDERREGIGIVETS